MKPHPIILADDFSGAAEVAGLAKQAGCSVRLSTVLNSHAEDVSSNELQVIDVASRDTRGVKPLWTQQLQQLGLNAENRHSIFIKIDSVLRGQVDQILEVLLEAGQSVLVIPGNPENGRYCENDILYVDGVPLAQSAFGQDPGSPAHTSSIRELLGTASRKTDKANFQIAECRDQTGIDQSVCDLHGADWCVAGSAAAFGAWLKRVAPTQSNPQLLKTSGPPSMPERRLHIAGSAHPRNFAWRKELKAAGQPTFDLSNPDLEPRVRDLINAGSSVYIFDDGATGLDEAATKIGRLLNSLPLEDYALCVDGGNTAAAIADKMNWSDFSVGHHYASGVVGLHPAKASIAEFIVKPGSYDWPKTLLSTTSC